MRTLDTPIVSPSRAVCKSERMDFPRLPDNFSPEAQAAIILAEVKASQVLAKQKPYGLTKGGTQVVIQYLMAVFEAFAKEACSVGRDRIWTVETVRIETMAFLRSVSMYAHWRYNDTFVMPQVIGYGGELHPPFLESCERTEEWRRYQDGMVELAILQSVPKVIPVARSYGEQPHADGAHAKTIGEQLDEIVLIGPLSHEQLAEEIGISRSAYFVVKAGGGGRKVKSKTSLYLSKRSK
jgi:hypothetical protein